MSIQVNLSWFEKLSWFSIEILEIHIWVIYRLCWWGIVCVCVEVESTQLATIGIVDIYAISG